MGRVWQLTGRPALLRTSLPRMCYRARPDFETALCFCTFDMGNVEETELISLVKEAKSASQVNHASGNGPPPISQPKSKTKWIRVLIYTLFVLFAQPVATLLGRLYYNKGGNCILLASLLETVGFPILIPFAMYFSPAVDHSNSHCLRNLPSVLILTTVYIFLGILHAAVNMLYAAGLLYLPVSTYSLISATQLAFNAFFSLFLNAQKLTFMIVNSLVLLTISSAILVFNSDSEQPAGISKRKRSIGFSCTLIASALYSLLLSLTQLSFQKVLRKETFTVLLNMIIYESIVATFVITLTMFASGQWMNLRNEIEQFELGKASYAIILVSISIAWQVFSIGAVGLIFEVSSLFSNVIGTVALPIVPVLAAIFFHDKMDAPKVVSIVLAVWGFTSYVYQHYLDHIKSREDDRNINDVPVASSTEIIYP